MKIRKIKKIGTKMALIMTMCVFLLAIALIFISYLSYRKTFKNYYSDKAQDEAKLLAKFIDGDEIYKAYETMEKTDYYNELAGILGKVKSESDAAYIYIYYPYDDHFIYILDAFAQNQKNGYSEIGERFDYRDIEYKYLVPDVKNKTASHNVITADDAGFGEGVVAWAPILKSDGSLAAMIEVDYYLDDVKSSTMEYVKWFSTVVFIGILLILLVLLHSNNMILVNPLKSVTDSIASYQKGNVKYPEGGIKTGDEIQEVYDNYVNMISKIDAYTNDLTKVTAEKERISTELNVATKIQADMLPSIFPAFPDRSEFDLYATMNPAKEVGGDFYDYYMIDDDHLALTMADVSGKGVPAALFMVISKTLLKNTVLQGKLSPAEVLYNVNNLLCENNEEAMFVTVWLGIYTISTGKMICSNGGHEYPAIFRKDKGYELYEDEHGFVLGAMPDMPFTNYELEFNAGDKLFVYTDGVPEAINVSEELYGTDRLVEALNDASDLGPVSTIDNVKEDMDNYVKEAEQFDDITMLAIEFK